MKRTALVCALILVATPAIAQRFWLVPAPHGGGPTALHFEDDITLGFGNTSAAPDCWMEWDTNATDDFELKCTDVDGGGTDGIIYSVDTGTNTLDVVGSIVAGTATIDAAAGTLTFTGATSATISTSTVDLTLSPGGGEVHVGADDSAKNVEIHSGGTFKMWDASDDTSITLDVDNGTTELDLTGSLAVSAALDVVGALSQDVETIADGDATPDVSGANLFVTSSNTGATVITDLDSPTVGQVIALCGGSNTNSSTIADAGNFALNGAMTLALDACLYLYVQADNDYMELGRNNVALTPWTSDVDGDIYDLRFTPGSGPADVTIDDNGIFAGARTTDAATGAFTITTEAPFTGATDTQTTGGNCVVQPAPGKWVLTGVTRAATAGDTLTITMQAQGVTAAPVVITEGVGTWNCAGAASDIACVCALYTYLTTTAPVTGLSVARTDGTCSDERLVLYVTSGTASYFTAVFSGEGGGDEVVTRGTNGQILLASNGICWGADYDGTNTCIYRSNANQTTFTINGNAALILDSLVSMYKTTDIRNQKLYSSSQAAQLGTAAATGHGLASGDVIDGGALEVDGASYFDGGADAASYTSHSASDIGWSVKAAADTACNTTCTHGCVFGQNTAALTYAIVGCADATADICVCAGAD